MSSQDWIEKDFYQTLGVAKNADQDQIKKAYRRLARRWHPDQNPGDKRAEEKFKEIGEAYAVLSNPEQRRKYDAVRQMASGGARFRAGPTSGAAGGPGFDDLFGSMFQGGNTRVRYQTGGAGGAGAGFDDLLSNLFGGGAHARSPFRGGFGSEFGNSGFAAPPQRGADLQAQATLTFRQALEGATVRMVAEGHSMTVRVPAGVRDGQRIRLRGRGRPGTAGGAPGDLVVRIHVEKHPVYEIDGDDLRMRVPVTYAEATLGARIRVPLPDGRGVALKLPAGTSSGTVLRVRRHGVRRGRRQGDLLVEVQIVAPRGLSPEARRALEDLRRLEPETDPRESLWEKAKV